MMNKSISQCPFKMLVFAFRGVLGHFNSIWHKLFRNINIWALKWLKIKFGTFGSHKKGLKQHF